MSGSTQPQLPYVTGVETIKRLKTLLCSPWDCLRQQHRHTILLELEWLLLIGIP